MEVRRKEIGKVRNNTQNTTGSWPIFDHWSKMQETRTYALFSLVKTASR